MEWKKQKAKMEANIRFFQMKAKKVEVDVQKKRSQMDENIRMWRMEENIFAIENEFGKVVSAQGQTTTSE